MRRLNTPQVAEQNQCRAELSCCLKVPAQPVYFVGSLLGDPRDERSPEPLTNVVFNPFDSFMELVIFSPVQYTGADCEDRPDSKEHVHRNEALGVRALLARLRRVVPERASEEGAR